MLAMPLWWTCSYRMLLAMFRLSASSESEWTLALEGITSGDATSLYRVLWENFGTTAAFTIAPNGNADPSSSEPHYEGTVKFDQLPPLTLTSNETATFSVTLTVVNTPHDPANDTYYGVEIVTA
jgi:hypothetical protein